MTTQSDAEGAFELSGLEEEVVTVRAEHQRHCRSSPTQVDLASGDTPGLEFVLRPDRAVRGFVRTSAGQPLPGVALAAYAAVGQPAVAFDSSRADGSFEFALPPSATAAVVIASLPRAVLWSGCFDLAAGSPLELIAPLAAGTATVALRLRRDVDLPPVAGGQLVLASGSGGLIPLTQLLGWDLTVARPDGDETLVVVGGLAPDRYSVAWSRGGSEALAGAACAGCFPRPLVEAGPGSTVALDFDLRPLQQRQLEAARRASR